MQYKATFVLLIIFIGVGAYLFFASRGGPDDQSIIAKNERILDLSAKRITQIGITEGGNPKLLLEKSDGQWRLLQPVQTKAQKESVEQLIAALLDLRRVGLIDRQEAERSRTVTTDPAFIVTLQAGDTTTLAIGQKSPAGDVTYAQINGRGKIFVIPAAIHNILARPVDDYRPGSANSTTK